MKRWCRQASGGLKMGRCGGQRSLRGLVHNPPHASDYSGPRKLDRQSGGRKAIPRGMKKHYPAEFKIEVALEALRGEKTLA